MEVTNFWAAANKPLRENLPSRSPQWTNNEPMNREEFCLPVTFSPSDNWSHVPILQRHHLEWLQSTDGNFPPSVGATGQILRFSTCEERAERHRFQSVIINKIPPPHFQPWYTMHADPIWLINKTRFTHSIYLTPSTWRFVLRVSFASTAPLEFFFLLFFFMVCGGGAQIFIWIFSHQ